MFIFLVLIFIEIYPKLFFFYKIIKKTLYYNLLINIREINKRTNLGKMYFENT